MKVFKNYINGEWVDSSGQETLPMVAPATGKHYGVISESTNEDVDRAVKAAREAYDTGEWGQKTATERGRLMLKFSDAILGKIDELTELEALDTGKPLQVARADIIALARYFEFYGGAADKLHGETIPYLNGYMVSVIREPFGVTGHILPWNYPAQMFGRTLAPSLAVGNATVLKPAEDACASALFLAELASETGFPRGAINVITGSGARSGAALAAHHDVDFMSFTGSPEVGQIIQKLCADHYITCTLELGGKSPQVVFDDADFDAAIPVIVNAIVQNSGQTCSAGSRVLIERKAYERFTHKLAEAFAKVTVGSPEMKHTCGPIITAKQKARVQKFIDNARAEGIAVLAEGQIDPAASPEGFFVKPTLFGPVPRTNALACDEVFGPVLSVMLFDDEKDAIQLANATEYGLVAAVWTTDGARQARLTKAIRSGQVFINCYGAGAGIELPFGGTGKSGHGREKGFAALHDFSITKTVVLNHG